MAQLPSPILHKTVMQIRYQPNIRFYDWLMSAAEKMAEYAYWETDRLSVTCKDFEKHCSLTITHNSIGYEQDSSDAELENERIGNLLQILPAALNINSLMRMGYRRQYLAAVNMAFDSLVAVLNIKLFSQHERLRSALPHKVTDVLYRIDAQSDDYGYHITVGPVRRNEIPKWLVYNLPNHLHPKTANQDYKNIVDAYPEVALLFDVDVYRAAPQIDIFDSQMFVDFARKDIDSMVNRLTQYLFATELEA